MTAKKLTLILCTCLIVFGSIIALTACKSVKPQWDYSWEENEDMSIMRERMLEGMRDDECDISSIIVEAQPDGSFSSVDYYTDKRDTWHPIHHLDKILLLQKAVFSHGNSYYNDTTATKIIDNAITFWVKNDFTCEWNGWWNGLGIGPKIADILLYDMDIATENFDLLLGKLSGITIYSETKLYNVHEREVDSTGGNLTDKVMHSLKYSIINNDGSEIKFLRRLMENELRPFPAKKAFSHRWDTEGIKADMSFQQHFEMLYMGGYGEVFLDGMNAFIEYTSGTQYALSDDKLNFYQDFILDGMQYSMRGEYRDINASGRGIVRENELKGIYSQVKTACQVLLENGAKLTRASELEYLVNNRNADSDIGAGGHKYFWSSDYQVYNDTNYMASVRAASKRTKNSEALNGENVLGHYLGAGATFYYIKGDEYYNAPPIMDWNKVPGTTALQGYLPIGGDNTYTKMGKTFFVGGVSNGKVGMSCLNYKANKVKAKKSWFMFKDGVVCLGADVQSSAKGELFTTINQSLLKGDLLYSQSGKVATTKYANNSGTFDWIYNNGIGYISANSLTLNAQHKNGDWQSISKRLESKMHSDDIFELGISHGSKQPKQNYDYTVLMNTSPDTLAAYKATPNLVTLSNNNKVQAVFDSKTGITMAVFWKSGSLTLPNGKTLKVNAPCTIIYDATSGKLTISNPYQTTKTIKITLDNSKYGVKFQKGMYGGQSQTIAL